MQTAISDFSPVNIISAPAPGGTQYREEKRRRTADFHLRIMYSRHETCHTIFTARNSDQKLFTPKERALQIISLTVKQRQCINISDELLAGKIGTAVCLLTNFTFVCNIILCKQFIVRQIRCC